MVHTHTQTSLHAFSSLLFSVCLSGLHGYQRAVSNSLFHTHTVVFKMQTACVLSYAAASECELLAGLILQRHSHSAVCDRCVVWPRLTLRGTIT